MLVNSPAFADEQLAFDLAIAGADDADAHGRRVWWRRPGPASNESGLPSPQVYVSLNPGETRREKPEKPGNVIREAPELNKSLTFSGLLRKAIEPFNVRAAPTGSRLEALIAIARRVLNEAQGKPDSSVLAEFRRINDSFILDELPDPVTRFRELFNFYTGYGIAGALFIPAYAILRAALWSGCCPRIEDTHIWAEPNRHVHGFLSSVWRNYPDRRDLFVKTANLLFVEAEAKLSAAFSAPTHLLFLRGLYAGCDLSLEAQFYATAFESEGALRTLDYSAQIAEEHFAWGVTGLRMSIPELLPARQSETRIRFAALIRLGLRERVERELDESTSLMKPLHYQAGAKLELAGALVEAGLPWAQDAFAILDELQAKLLESDWIPGYWDERDALDLTRMEACKACGDKESASTLDRAIAARELATENFGE